MYGHIFVMAIQIIRVPAANNIKQLVIVVVIVFSLLWQQSQLLYPIQFEIVVALRDVVNFAANTLISTNNNTNETTNAFHHNNDKIKPSSSSSSSNLFAYVFMAFGCDPGNIIDDNNQTIIPAYRPYIANMLAATHVLRQQGSQADIIAMFKFKHPNIHKLPAQDESMLHALGIQIRYIPYIPEWSSSENRNFLVGVLNKIHILNLTEYQRVLFLDGDVLPLRNLDYLMELSYRGEWQKTVILSTAVVPMIAGLFVITPNATLYEQVYQLVHNKIVNNQLIGRSFNSTEGWGHVWDPTIDGPYLWESNHAKGTSWAYYGVNGDQGIFYYYPKYIQKSLTQIMGDEVFHFGENGTRWQTNSLPPQSSSSIWDGEAPNCQRWTRRQGGCFVPPYSDHAHFTKPFSKPWQVAAPPKEKEPTSAYDLWWKILYELEDKYPSVIQVEKLIPSEKVIKW